MALYMSVEALYWRMTPSISNSATFVSFLLISALQNTTTLLLNFTFSSQTFRYQQQMTATFSLFPFTLTVMIQKRAGFLQCIALKPGYSEGRDTETEYLNNINKQPPNSFHHKYPTSNHQLHTQQDKENLYFVSHPQYQRFQCFMIFTQHV